MSVDQELEAIERRIEGLKGNRTADAGAKLQRLYIERERAQERQFKKSLARRAKAGSRSTATDAPKAPSEKS